MSEIAIAPVPLDHCVLPVADLATARARFSALGFTVAPEGVHPFGTKNACVYFADDTFLEPLAVADEDLANAASLAGNVFIERDRVFRGARGEGFSAIVLGSGDADADHERFVEAGISAGARLDFSRGYVDAAGSARTVSFRLAFAAPAAGSKAFFFTCERVDAPAGGRGPLAIHGNGVKGLSRLVAIADDPRSHSSFFRAFTGSPPKELDGGLLVEAAKAPIVVLEPDAFEQEFGMIAERSAGLSLSALMFAVSTLDGVEALFARSGIPFDIVGNRIVVPAVPGQGAIFAFEEVQWTDPTQSWPRERRLSTIPDR